MRNIFIFLGPPGSGKGSLSQLCTQKLGWDQLSTGNLCRRHIAQQTDIGKAIDFAIKSGKLVSDELVIQMVADWFEKTKDRSQAVILDGYPRTVAQAQAFDQLLKTKFPSLKLHIVSFFISDECVVKRLSTRYICQNLDCQLIYSIERDSHLMPKKSHMHCDVCGHELMRRTDDELHVIKERLASYYKYTSSLLHFYTQLGQHIVELNVEKPLQVVFDEFKVLTGIHAS